MLGRGASIASRLARVVSPSPCAALSTRAWTISTARPAVSGLMQSRAMSAVSTTNTVHPIVVKTPSGAMAGSESYAYDPYEGKHATKNNGRAEPGDPSRRAFAYFVMGSARFVYASLARLTVIKFVHYMNASADVLALASIEVPIGNIPAGGCIVVKWRGKPVFIKKRTEEELADIYAVDWKSLRDPQSDKARRVKEEVMSPRGREETA